MEKTEYQINIINRVRDLRQKYGVSQAQLSTIIGVTPGQLGNIESSKYSHKYTLNHLNQIANYFGVPIEIFFMEEGETEMDLSLYTNRLCEYLGG